MTDLHDVWVDLWLDGEPMADLPGKLVSLEVHEQVDQASSFRIVLGMGVSPENDWTLLTDGRFILLRRVTVRIRLSGVGETATRHQAYVMEGFVTAVEPHIPPSRYGEAQLTLEGLDASCLLHFDERTRRWEGVVDRDIATRVYGEYGFGVDTGGDDPVPRRDADRGGLVQRSTDAELLRLLARRNGLVAYVERTDAEVGRGAAPAPGSVVGHFHRAFRDPAPQGSVSLRPGESPQVTEFRARWESHAPTRIVAGRVDERTRRVEPVTAERTRYPKMGSHARADLLQARLGAILPSRPGVVSSMRAFFDAPQDRADLENLAWAELEAADWLARATATVNGLRYPGVLRPRRALDLADGGRILSGSWFVRSARHRLVWDASPRRYDVDLDLVRNALGAVA